jgi:hypothetical protein
MADSVAKFSPLVYGPAAFRADMVGMPPGNENCLKSFAMPVSSSDISGLIFAVRTFQIGIATSAGLPWPAGNVEHVQVVFLINLFRCTYMK